MKKNLLLVMACLSLTRIYGAEKTWTEPIVSPDLVIQESDGFVAVEAEHFVRQEKSGVRAWHLTTFDHEAGITPDADPNHTEGASGAAYLEILPDTRKNHGEKLIKGQNFINEPGKMAILSYNIHFKNTGKYYVWARIYSTGTEDNGVHVGIDGTWPESGQRMQWTAKNHWAWGSKQRTAKVHTGVPGILYLNIESPGVHTIQFSMREDGFEFDQFLMTKDAGFKQPSRAVKVSKPRQGKLPAPFRTAQKPAFTSTQKVPVAATSLVMGDFPGRKNAYVDNGKWFAVNPEAHKKSVVAGTWPFNSGVFDLTLHAVGENDGQSSYSVLLEGEEIGSFKCPLSKEMFEEGKAFTHTFKNVRIDEKAKIEVIANIGSADGNEFSRARWSRISVQPRDNKKLVRKVSPSAVEKNVAVPVEKQVSFSGNLFGDRTPDGDGSIEISGELKTWHKVALTLDGPYAHEKDNNPNPFTDLRFQMVFKHESGTRTYSVPGYFAADGKAGESSAESGTKWRVLFAPDLDGTWSYSVAFHQGELAALNGGGAAMSPWHGKTGSFKITKSDKSGRDLRSKGRLQYVGKHHLKFAGTEEWFVKAGADAPETFLAYKDFDGTIAMKPGVPLKSWEPHIQDWQNGDPSWKGGKGKGIIGAINYLSGKGCNVFSFLTYNAGGDGDNIWPFIERDDKLNYDCSKLDQWSIVLDHGTARGMYLHFKLQETENDDNKRGGRNRVVPTSLDGGDLGIERKLYVREIVARFGHNLALNWNLGEENTQTTSQQREMAQYIADQDPYDHLIVVHSYPNQQDQVYRPLLGDGSVLSGASLQNSNIRDCHHQVVKWTRESAATGKPWVIGFDEPGTASEGMPADPGYPGMPANFNNPSIHDTRKYALWGTLMAGGSGVEYYFGYKLPQNDLVCEDWRSRDLSWDYCRIALDFFGTLPLGDMANTNELTGNTKHDNSAYCFSKQGELYLVYLPVGGSRSLDLSNANGNFSLSWFNPRTGKSLHSDTAYQGGQKVSVAAPGNEKNDWLAVIKKNN